MNALYLAALSLTLAAPLEGIEGLTDILGGAESGIVYFEEKFTSWMDDINSQIDHAGTIIKGGVDFIQTGVDGIFHVAEQGIFSIDHAIGITVTVPPIVTDKDGGPSLATISPGGYPYQNNLPLTTTALSDLKLPGLPDLGGLLGGLGGAGNPLAAATGLAARGGDDAAAGLDGLTDLLGEVTGLLGGLGGDGSPLAAATGLTGGLEGRDADDAAAGLDGLTGLLGEVTGLLGGLGDLGGDGNPLAAATGLTGGLAARAANSSSSSTAAASSSANGAMHAAIGVSAIAGFVGALLL